MTSLSVIAVLKVVHVLNALLMAWPYYALVAVNQRARLGPPLGDRADTYLENVIRNRTIPCFVFQATALVTGLALILTRGQGLAPLVRNGALAAKFLLLVLIGALLAYVHLRIQPQIDALFGAAGTAPDPDTASRIGALRLRRKRLASLCLFAVFTSAVLGVGVWAAYPWWVTVALIAAVAALTGRAYASTTPYGWI